MRDLEGILVISLEQAVAAPLATARLADAGARVIKVERPEGDFARGYDRLVHGESAYFVWINRGKQSICLDLRQNDDLALLHRMIAAADVFVQNLAPGATDRLGVGAAAMCAANPRLIYVSISGYGEDGPYRDQKAYDMLIQGESGLLSVNGTPEGSARVGISVCDIAAGETAYGAILQSLIARAPPCKRHRPRYLRPASPACCGSTPGLPPWLQTLPPLTTAGWTPFLCRNATTHACCTTQPN